MDDRMVEPDQMIEEFDPIVEVMSDKATVEITSPFTGRITNLAGVIGDMVKVGGRLCDVDVDDGAADAGIISTPAPRIDPTPGSVLATSSSTVSPAITVELRPSKHLIHATPSTRRLAKESSISLGDVVGTGKEGRVTKSDVMAFVAKSSSTSSLPIPSPVPIVESTATSSTRIIPLTPLRKSMFRAMTATLAIPHFSYSDTIDVTALLALRAQLNKSVPLYLRKTLTMAEEAELSRGVELWGRPGRVIEEERVGSVSLMPLLVKALSKAMVDHPLFSCSLSTDAQPHLIHRSSHDISLAVSSPTGGLFTPLLPSVESTSSYHLASQIAALQFAASNSTATSPPKFPPRSKGTGTITLSNIGVIGGTTTAPIIPPTGQLVIGALGKARVVPTYLPSQVEYAKDIALRSVKGDIVEEGELESLRVVPRMMMDVTFSADHRVVEGVELARLVESWKVIVENPGAMSS